MSKMLKAATVKGFSFGMISYNSIKWNYSKNRWKISFSELVKLNPICDFRQGGVILVILQYRTNEILF